MGWLQEYKDKNEEMDHERQLAKWQAQCSNINNCIKLTQTFNGTTTDEIMLHPGELLYLKVNDVSLIEDRLGAGHWQGRSSGISVPVTHIGGSAIRYHIGATKGTYIQGTPHPEAIDTGAVYITNQRLIFEGAKQTRECDFNKLLGYQHDKTEGSTTISISNRQKPITLHYGAEAAPAFEFRLSLALSHYKNTVPQLIQQLNDTLTQLESTKPIDPLQNTPNQ